MIRKKWQLGESVVEHMVYMVSYMHTHFHCKRL